MLVAFQFHTAAALGSLKVSPGFACLVSQTPQAEPLAPSPSVLWTESCYCLHGCTGAQDLAELNAAAGEAGLPGQSRVLCAAGRTVLGRELSWHAGQFLKTVGACMLVRTAGALPECQRLWHHFREPTGACGTCCAVKTCTLDGCSFASAAVQRQTCSSCGRHMAICQRSMLAMSWDSQLFPEQGDSPRLLIS